MRHPFLVAILLLAALPGCSRKQPIACTAPRSYWSMPDATGPEAIYNQLTLDRHGKAYWNGVPVSDAVLNRMLKTARSYNPKPQLVLETEMGLPCARLEAVRDKIDTLLDCRHNRTVCSEGFRFLTPLPGHVANPVAAPDK
ncbi:hypothetical protein WBP06_12570 [Novosphingobium sp. BL-8H]|uniref:hypothetical protein n=1 Tax=Novosphingobium sp. BL-8H TaxID=3127640 RepID=UPI003756E135